MGGGNAMPRAVLAGLKEMAVEVSAVCAVLDTGGSSGRLRREYGVLSPGDMRRALLALAETSDAMKSVFDYRFQEGEFSGHNFANLFISTLELSLDSREKAIEEMNRIMGVSRFVFPATVDDAELCVKLHDGSTVCGESKIDKNTHNKKITEVFLDRKADLYFKASQEIKESDLVIIGPGDLYSSLAQVLLVCGMREVLKDKKVVYVCNICCKKGETEDFQVSDFVSVIENLIGKRPEFVLCNTTNPGEERLQEYKRKHPELTEMVKGVDGFTGRDLLLDRGPVEHDPYKLSKAIFELS